MKIIKCDICGSTEKVEHAIVPVYRMFDGCDGKTFYDKPVIDKAEIDICEDCQRKMTNIKDLRVMGYGGFSIQKNPEL